MYVYLTHTVTGREHSSLPQRHWQINWKINKHILLTPTAASCFSIRLFVNDKIWRAWVPLPLHSPKAPPKAARHTCWPKLYSFQTLVFKFLWLPIKKKCVSVDTCQNPEKGCLSGLCWTKDHCCLNLRIRFWKEDTSNSIQHGKNEPLRKSPHLPLTGGFLFCVAVSGSRRAAMFFFF